METLWRDLRHAARALRRRPAVTAVSAVTLAVGLGGATAIFSVADAVVLRPLPFRDPDRLVVVSQSDLRRNQPFVEISYPAFRAWRDEGRAFEALAALPSSNQPFVLTGHGEPRRLMGLPVTAGFFDVLGVRPALGRGLRPDDDRPGAPPVVVLSDRLWRELFAADPAVIGRTITFGADAHEIVGVMPAGFAYPRGAELWAAFGPAAGWAIENPGVFWMIAVGRLAPDASARAARTELDAIWARLYGPHIDTRGYAAVLTPLGETVLGASRPALLALLAAVALVLLIACANVAGLSIVHATERRSEWAVRQAMGASIARLARLLVAESLLLTALGGLGGLVLAACGTPLLVAMAPAGVPRLDEVALNGRALIFGLGACGVSAVVAGLAPVLLLRRSSLDEVLRTGPRTMATGKSPLRPALVVAEIALALVLLVGAGLLIRTFWNLRAVPLGFDADRVLALDVTVPPERYSTDAAWRDFYARLLERIRLLPGVESAATVTLRPLWGPIGMDWSFEAEGQTKQDAARNPVLNLEAVSPDYFRAMGIPIRRGRALGYEDDAGRPGTAVVSETLARRTWPGQDPIGKRLKLPMPDTPYDNAWLTVVGVAGDVRYRELQEARLDLYMSSRQANHRPKHVIVRTHIEPLAVTSAVREAVRTLDPGVPVTDVVTLSDAVSTELGNPRFAAQVFAGFAAVALFLSGLGLYGLLASSVTRRTREIGVRVALGAGRRDVRWLVLREALGLTAIGAVLGLGLSWALGRLLESLLFGVSAVDAGSAAAALLLLGALVAVAVLLPARRAARVEPAVALRAE